MRTAKIIVVSLIFCLAGCRSAPHALTPFQTAAPPAMAATNAAPSSSAASSEDVRAVTYIQDTARADRVDQLLPLSLETASELTLPQLEQIALANNPTLSEARARVEAIRGKRVQVGLPPNPHVGFSDQQLGSGGQAEQYGIYFGQEVIRGGKLRLNRAVASQEIEIAEHEWSAQQQRVLTDVRLGFYEVLIAQRRVEVCETLLGVADEAMKMTETMFVAKETSQIELIRTQVEQQSARLTLTNARTSNAAAWSRLAAVLGTPEVESRHLIGELESAALDLHAEESLARLLKESPEMGAAIAEVDRARCAVQRACAEPIPNLNLQTVAQYDNSLDSANGNLQMTMPIPWLNRNQGEIRQTRAELMAAQQSLGRIELDLKSRLATVYQQYASARNQVQEYGMQGGILDKSKSMLELVQKGAEAGELNYLDLAIAQRQNSQNNLAYVEALGQMCMAFIEIEGLLLKDSLQGRH